MVEYNGYEFALKAADLYRLLRKKRSYNHKGKRLLTRAICIENNFLIIHNDKDFGNIAKHTTLSIYQ